MENHINVLVARNFEESCVLRILFPKQWVSCYAFDTNEGSHMWDHGFLELSTAGIIPTMVPVTIAYDEKCLSEETPDGTIFALDGGRFVKAAGSLFPANIRDYVYVSYEVAAEANVHWLPK